MPKQLQQTFSVDRSLPGMVLRLEAIRAQLDQKDARLAVVAQVGIEGATRGPGGDIFGTNEWYPPQYYDEVHWNEDGTVL